MKISAAPLIGTMITSKHPGRKSNVRLLVTFSLMCLLLFLFFSEHIVTPLSDHGLAGGLLLILFFATIKRDQTGCAPTLAGSSLRVFIVVASLFLWLRYLVWRGSETLPLEFGVASAICGVLLFFAECYCFVNSTLGYLAVIKPRYRDAIALPTDLDALPTVDVFIPTYNEDPSILRPTVIAATQMRYPAHKLRVYVLDDGGTQQKLTDPDPEKAAEAQRRSDEVQAIAHQFGAVYLTRERNEHAKAGNINAALKHTAGELLVVLDCDHVPTMDFVEKTVGFFLADAKLFLVQTPHNFINADPLERNLSSFNQSPAENELFYGAILPGLDGWGTTFFCGSAAVLRRCVLDEIGGIAGQTVTEDAETTLDALSLGYTTAYFNHPMVSGLQPESFSGFILQRVRWGQGMLQIFLLKNPWLQPGLTLMQRILYTNFSLFWGFPLFRLILILAPLVGLLFPVPLADSNVTDVLLFGLPSLLASTMASQYLYGRLRWPFISHLYEVVQSIHLSAGIFRVLRRPRSPAFLVTPKGEVMRRDFISSLAKPFYFLLFINCAALVSGVIRFDAEPENQAPILFAEFWASFDLLLLLCALGVTFERKQRRAEPRAPIQQPERLHTADGVTLKGHAVDASTSGARVMLTCTPDELGRLQKQSFLTIEFPEQGITLQCHAQTAKHFDAHSASVGLAYRLQSTQDDRHAVQIAFGSSEQLKKNMRRRHQGQSVIVGMGNLIGNAIRHGLGHLLFLLPTMKNKNLRQQKPELEKK